MNKVGEVEAVITLEALDDNVLSTLTSSVERMPSASETTPNNKRMGKSLVLFLIFESQEQETPSSLASPIIPFESGIR